MTLAGIGDTILDETSTPRQLHQALDEFARLAADAGGVEPDPSYDGWSTDTFLDDGVAINPEAAGHCVRDYRRSVCFIRGLYAATRAAQARFSTTPVRILYAGCGPYATLLLPLLGRFRAGELSIHLLDIHQRSLDSVRCLIDRFGFNAYDIKTIQADACSYQHVDTLHVVIAETMQKSMEQEPQFAVTANLAPQLCPQGIFIPERIDVELCLAHLDSEQALYASKGRVDGDALEAIGERHPLTPVLALMPRLAAAQLRTAAVKQGSANPSLPPKRFAIPSLANLQGFEPVLFTRIQVYGNYRLQDYEAEISLPQRCHDVLPLAGGEAYWIHYQLGSYPRFNINRLSCE